MTRLRIGISTCPNDTFTYHALLRGAVRIEGAELEFELLDIEELNRGLAAGRFDVAKVSTAAAVRHAARTLCLPVGWAVGHGVGPVVLAGRGRPPGSRERLVLSPGEGTTATLLWRMLHAGQPWRLEHRVFSEILPALARGEADLGVCIHEARFTHAELGLECVEDLGESWQQLTDHPLPLGGPVASRSLPSSLLEELVAATRRSLAYSREHPTEALESMRAHAQETADAVLWKHVELYVTELTRDLGREGKGALLGFAEEARRHGLAPDGATLEVLGP